MVIKTHWFSLFLFFSDNTVDYNYGKFLIIRYKSCISYKKILDTHTLCPFSFINCTFFTVHNILSVTRRILATSFVGRILYPCTIVFYGAYPLLNLHLSDILSFFIC